MTHKYVFIIEIEKRNKLSINNIQEKKLDNKLFKYNRMFWERSNKGQIWTRKSWEMLINVRKVLIL